MLIPHLRHMTLLCCLGLTCWQVVLPVVYIRDLMLIRAGESAPVNGIIVLGHAEPCTLRAEIHLSPLMVNR